MIIKKIKSNSEFIYLNILICFAIPCVSVVLYSYYYSFTNFEENFHKIFTTSDESTLISKSEALASTGDFIGGISNPIISLVTIGALFLLFTYKEKKLIKVKN